MMGSPTAELARKLMNKDANKLAKELQHHKPEDVEALIEALDRYELHRNDSLSIGSYDRLKAAREKLAPKPANGYVLSCKRPDWFYSFTKELVSAARQNVQWEDVVDSFWDKLRELTATTAAEQKWNMPTLQQINEICGQLYGTAPTNALDTWYEAIRNKIMSLS